MGNKLFVDANAKGIVPLLPLDGLKTALSPTPPAAGGVR
jgi:hypothetical protein